jgi:hypothetical protein
VSWFGDETAVETSDSIVVPAKILSPLQPTSQNVNRVIEYFDTTEYGYEPKVSRQILAAFQVAEVYRDR